MNEPVRWASTLASMVLSPHATPAQRLDTLRAAGPAIARIVGALPGTREVDVAQALICLAQASEAAGAEGLRVAAAHLAAPLLAPDASAVLRGLTDAISDGAGTRLAVALASALRARGATERALGVEQAIADGMTRVHRAYVRATRSVKKLEVAIASLPPEQRPAAKRKGSGKYAAAENAAKLIGLTADGATAALTGGGAVLQRASERVLRSWQEPTQWD